MIQNRYFKSQAFLLILTLSILISCVTPPEGFVSNANKDPFELYNGPEDAESVIALLEKQNSEEWDTDTRFFYSTLLLVAQRKDDAREQLLILKDQKPDDKEVLMNLAILNEYSGNEKESMGNLDAILDIDPDHTQANALKGKILVEQGQYEAARGNFVLVLQKEPENLEALIGLADCLMRTDKLKDSLRVLDKAIELYPEDPYLRVNRSRVLNAERKFNKAYKDLTKAIEIQPDNSWHYLDRARIAMSQFLDKELALKDLQTALELGNDNLFIHYYMGEIYDDLEEYDKALYHMEKTLSINEEFYYAYETYAKLLFIKGDYSGAFQNYIKAYHYFEKNNGYFLMAYGCKVLNGEKAEAKSFLSDVASSVKRGSLEYELFRYYLGVSSSYAVNDKMDRETDQSLRTRMTFFVGLKDVLDGNSNAALKVFHTLKENSGSYEYELAHWYLSQF